MGLMGSFYVGTSGLRTSQNALNTVAHNMTNLGTPGYTRQQILLGDRRYTTISKSPRSVGQQQVGHGVVYAQTRQVRDYFLDKNYRKEVGRVGFHEASYSAVSDVELLFDEMYGRSFGENLEDLRLAFTELAKNPTDAVNQSVLVHRSAQFLERAKDIYSGMCANQDNINFVIKQEVDRVNEIGHLIRDLNKEILSVEMAGIENANDLKDIRNSLLDELGSLVNMTYTADVDGVVHVNIEGRKFVSNTLVYEMGLYTDEKTGFVTPYWLTDAKTTIDAAGNKQVDISSAKVFNLSRPVYSNSNSDVGSIKAMMMARGEERGSYLHLDPNTYSDSISQSVNMNVQAEFDALVHHIVTQINEVLAEADYMFDENGDPMRLFVRIGDDGQPESTAPGDENTLYTIANLAINPKLLGNPSLLSFSKPGVEEGEFEEDFDLAQKLCDIFTAEEYTLNPNVTAKYTLPGLYNSIVHQIGNLGLGFKTSLGVFEESAVSLDNARQQVMGVSDDEEMSSMIKFQNGYNAASRYINVIDEMLEHIISTLGR